MLRAILEAILDGMRKAFSFAGRIVLWPFTLFGGGGRRSRPGPDMTKIQEAEKSLDAARAKDSPVVQSTLRESDLRRDAQIAWGWCTTSLMTRQQLPFPSTLSKKMQSWLQGLDHTQLECLQKASAAGISAHAAGTKEITGVPRVGPLAPVMLKFPPNAKPDAKISDFALSLSR